MPGPSAGNLEVPRGPGRPSGGRTGRAAVLWVGLCDNRLAMLLHAVLLASFLGGTPYPQPRLTRVSDRLKCDYGKVLSVDVAKGELAVMTAAGAVHYRAGADVQVFDKAGAPLGATSQLTPGEKVRVYYVVSEGAVASEIVVE